MEHCIFFLQIKQCLQDHCFGMPYVTGFGLYVTGFGLHIFFYTVFWFKGKLVDILKLIFLCSIYKLQIT